MKTKVAPLILVVFTVTAVLSALAINRQIRGSQSPCGRKREFIVSGIVRGIDATNKLIRIEHEEIPDYMPAMTMPLSVKETALLQGLQSGETIEFTLAVTEDDSWISGIRKTEETTTATSFSSKREALKTTRESELLTVGEMIPDFVLTDQNSKKVRLSEFKGKAVILTFIYTRCPLPNFCPLMSKNFSALQQRLATEFADNFHLLSVSIDPKFDTPDVLKAYSMVWSKDEKSWSFLSGTAEETETVGRAFGLIYEESGGLINHDLRTALIGPDGKLVHIWKSNVWTPYEIQRMVRETLTGKRDVASAD